MFEAVMFDSVAGAWFVTREGNHREPLPGGLLQGLRDYGNQGFRVIGTADKDGEFIQVLLQKGVPPSSGRLLDEQEMGFRVHTGRMNAAR
jgi:hypothetical protein